MTNLFDFILHFPDSANFAIEIGEVIAEFSVFEKNGWGTGLSHHHFKKIITRDESVFTTTWAEMRRDFFQKLLWKIGSGIAKVKVPLPRHPDGRILSDEDISKRVKEGYRLMFCPVAKSWEFTGTPLISLHYMDYTRGEYNKDWLKELDDRSRGIKKPYWFWINCSEGGSSFYGNRIWDKCSTFIEYSIARYAFREEMSKPLDEKNLIWLRHNHPSDKQIVVGAEPPQKIWRENIVEEGEEYEIQPRKSDGSDSIRIPITTRFVEVLQTS